MIIKDSDLLRLPFDLRALILPDGGPHLRMVCKALRDEFDGLNTRLLLGRVRLISSPILNRESEDTADTEGEDDSSSPSVSAVSSSEEEDGEDEEDEEDEESICNQALKLQEMLNLVKRTPKLSHLR